MSKWNWMAGCVLLTCCLSCGSDDGAATNTPPPAPDASTHDDELVAAFTTSACARPVECQSPSAGQCKAYTEQQIRQALSRVTWTQAQLEQCTADRRRVVACVAAADCAAILAVTDCVNEKQTYVDNCAPLLAALSG